MTEEVINVERQRTAIRRNTLSRPLRLAQQHGILASDKTLFDYGCGHGDDIRLLADAGYSVTGWDPLNFSSGAKRTADVVNLGYVLNVIENLDERIATLQDAWDFATETLVVSARTTLEQFEGHDAFNDGVITSRGTFQKFFTQKELQDYLREALKQDPIAVAPGVFYVFRNPGQRESFLASNSRRSNAAPKIRRTDLLYAQHQEYLDALAEFFTRRGRLPGEADRFDCTELTARLGSVKRAFLVLKRVFTREHWAGIVEGAKQDLLVYLALAKFRGRAKFSDLEPSLRSDIRSLFGTYSKACDLADDMLFSAGDRAASEIALASSQIGKLTQAGLYLHRSVLTSLSPLLRVYEGCARVLVGEIEGANVIKLHRTKFAISYLHYPDFETDPHPALNGSLIVYLSSRDVRFRDYSQSDNPPILHRKEEFVSADHPLRSEFESLTRAEESCGLFEDTSRIGLRQGWEELLKAKGLSLNGHSIAANVADEGCDS